MARVAVALLAETLVCRSNDLLCALPLSRVVETMRPLPVEPVSGALPFLIGSAIIRGEPASVLNLGLLLGGEKVLPSRFVTMRLGVRHAALAVEQVIGVRSLGALSVAPLLSMMKSNAWVEALRAHDNDLLLMLSEASVVSEERFA